ncbi:hypothetical protein EHQ27_05455 [Leptospira wolffii]|uniref:Lp29 family lipoprotein n=1 Tax=Leptospira wolffii TaxID=409998 RepID=UPI0010832A1D|nr:hypothetical protein [Leptospira wolffii]TGK62761.1 hypothetical protein EHQ32_08145 [Leptospira wolffii]TGK73852.1 hypothetical protein EHQ35_05620 [Leptospira wolffii]TGK75007.1 hypothetical protein EHQ27_05455 [Leptospira wolffii]TGL28714.1 hypothetical protein EHQ57_12145 [Leptospira wolffii]
MLFRIYWLLVFHIAFLSCASRYLVDPPSEALENDKFNKKVKIAYLGFNSFKSTKLKNPDGTVAFEALSDPDSRTLKEPIYGGFPIPNENKPTGFRKDVPQEKVLYFAKSFLGVTGPTGVKELEKFLEIGRSGDQYTYSLRILPYDYYIMGLHDPVFEKPRNIFLNFVTIFSSLFSVASIGILPSYEAYSATTKVLVFDKNLNLIKEFEYNNDYSVLRSLWVFPNPPECRIGSLSCLGMFSPTVKTTPAFVFEGNSRKIGSDLSKFVSNLK